MKSLINKVYNDYLVYLADAKNYIENAPEGSLSMQHKNGHHYFYQKISCNGKKKVKYINKDDKYLIHELAQKSYYIKMVCLIEKRLSIFEELINSYKTDIDDLYDEFPEVKKMMIKPIVPTLKQKIDNWKNEKETNYKEYPETLRFHTQRGELVRSKSELMIADQLFKRTDLLDYKYEQELIMYKNGNEIKLHPDFKIINLKSGRIVYWEHFGRMDDIKYVNSCINKINIYSLNGLVIGRDIVITFEDSYHPLDSLQIIQTISIIEQQ